MVAAGRVIGRVTGRHGSTEIRAAHAGTAVEWLAFPGDPVTPGQPLLRLHPDGVDH
jgi:[acyl-carrier-protein] S-malonyltransferase